MVTVITTAGCHTHWECVCVVGHHCGVAGWGLGPHTHTHKIIPMAIVTVIVLGNKIILLSSVGGDRRHMSHHHRIRREGSL